VTNTIGYDNKHGIWSCRFLEVAFLPWLFGIKPYLTYHFLGGWSAVIWSIAVPMVITWHSTFLVNSAAHVYGRRPYETGAAVRTASCSRNVLVKVVSLCKCCATAIGRACSSSAWHWRAHDHWSTAGSCMCTFCSCGALQVIDKQLHDVPSTGNAQQRWALVMPA
jgi:hypothetical protein